MGTGTCASCGTEATGPWCTGCGTLVGAPAARAGVPTGVPFGYGGPADPTAPITVVGGPPAPPGLVVESTKEDRIPTPYVGPDPLPSRPFALMVQIACAVAAGVGLLLAIAWCQRWSVHSGMVVHGRTQSAVNQVQRSNLVIAALAVLTRIAVVVTIVGEVLWRRARRPKDRLQTHGEGFIELPLTWIIPTRLRVGRGLLFAAMAWCFVNGTTTQFTTVDQLPSKDLWNGAAWVFWAIAMSLVAVSPGLSARAHATRMAWSAWYRERPGSVPYIPAIADKANESEGIGWVFRTTGLFFAVLFAVTTVLVGLGYLNTDPMAGVFWLMVGGLSTTLVVRSIVRRRQKRGGTAKAAAAPSVPMTPF